MYNVDIIPQTSIRSQDNAEVRALVKEFLQLHLQICLTARYQTFCIIKAKKKLSLALRCTIVLLFLQSEVEI